MTKPIANQDVSSEAKRTAAINELLGQPSAESGPADAGIDASTAAGDGGSEQDKGPENVVLNLNGADRTFTRDELQQLASDSLEMDQRKAVIDGEMRQMSGYAAQVDFIDTLNDSQRAMLSSLGDDPTQAPPSQLQRFSEDEPVRVDDVLGNSNTKSSQATRALEGRLEKAERALRVLSGSELERVEVKRMDTIRDEAGRQLEAFPMFQTNNGMDRVQRESVVGSRELAINALVRQVQHNPKANIAKEAAAMTASYQGILNQQSKPGASPIRSESRAIFGDSAGRGDEIMSPGGTASKVARIFDEFGL